MSDLWAILNLQPVYFRAGWCLRVHTDVPVHLWLYFTKTRVRKQPRSVNIRGIMIPWDNRFCFVKDEGLEQKEVGDTLTHTFPFLYWEKPPKMWVTFRGLISGVWSPSVGPIFKIYSFWPTVMNNWNWLYWRRPSNIPLDWDTFTSGSGWSKWHRVELGIPQKHFAPKLEAGGYARLTGLRQALPVDALRNQAVRFSLRAYGYAYPNNGLHLYSDGTNPINHFANITRMYDWQQITAQGNVPDDATFLKIECRCYSPGYGPVFVTFDQFENDLYG